MLIQLDNASLSVLDTWQCYAVGWFGYATHTSAGLDAYVVSTSILSGHFLHNHTVGLLTC